MDKMMYVFFLATIVGIFSAVFAKTWSLRVVAILTVVSGIVPILIPIWLVNVGLWIPSLVYLFQILQITTVGFGLFYCTDAAINDGEDHFSRQYTYRY